MALPIRSVFEAVHRFYDHALDDGEYLQPQKLHRMLYLAQAYWGATHYGKPLYPAVFIADERGPMEPNVDAEMEHFRPDVTMHPLPEAVRHFVESIWRQFGHHGVEHLTRTLMDHPPFQQAFRQERGSVIDFGEMAAFYARARTRTAPRPERILRPRVMRNAQGKPVATSAWAPRKLK